MQRNALFKVKLYHTPDFPLTLSAAVKPIAPNLARRQAGETLTDLIGYSIFVR
jgi:hypothetical protein